MLLKLCINVFLQKKGKTPLKGEQGTKPKATKRLLRNIPDDTVSIFTPDLRVISSEIKQQKIDLLGKVIGLGVGGSFRKFHCFGLQRQANLLQPCLTCLTSSFFSFSGALCSLAKVKRSMDFTLPILL